MKSLLRVAAVFALLGAAWPTCGGRFEEGGSTSMADSASAGAPGVDALGGVPSDSSAGTVGASGDGGNGESGLVDIELELCTGNERFGEPCKPTGRIDANGYLVPERGCWVRHCGVDAYVVCIDGTWHMDGYEPPERSTPWDFVCSPEEEDAFGIPDLQTGQCCGESFTRESINWPGCRYCPALAPADSSACSLPAECGSDAAESDPAAPVVIDCLYDCCCYGTVTWAQCDGTRWHVKTNCSPK